MRERLNGIESSVHSGLLMSNANFGRDTVTNLRLGTPTMLAQSIGSSHRGFRRWKMQAFAGDAWNVGRGFTVNFGLRYEPVTRPLEVNRLSEVPIGCDCNNFAPRVGFAFRSPRLGVLRGAYGLHYGEIFAATYSLVRFNPPGNILLSVVDPKVVLLDPLAGVATDALDPNARSGVIRLVPDLVAPYSHQYNASWEIATAGGWYAQLGYTGSRTHRLLSTWVFNRARPVRGAERTTQTVNQRRPDSRYFEVRLILNGSRAYFDAARATAGVREWRGLTAEFSYWSSKAIDLGAHFANNATYRDSFTGMSQTESDVHADVKALSEFDQPRRSPGSDTRSRQSAPRKVSGTKRSGGGGYSRLSSSRAAPRLPSTPGPTRPGSAMSTVYRAIARMSPIHPFWDGRSIIRTRPRGTFRVRLSATSALRSPGATWRAMPCARMASRMSISQFPGSGRSGGESRWRSVQNPSICSTLHSSRCPATNSAAATLARSPTPSTTGARSASRLGCRSESPIQ